MKIILALSIFYLVVCIFYVEIQKRIENKKRKRIEEESATGIDRKIETLRSRFRDEPIGQWVSCQGTFNMIRNSEWIFYRDGRGRKVERSLREGETSSEFFWRKNSEYSIEIRGPEPEAEWRTICYDFRAISTDVGLLPALVEIDETGNILNEFGVLEVPLSFVEDTENDTIGSGVPEED